MAADTKVFQDMADAMLPLFDNMPQVIVLVEDHEAFHKHPVPGAVYSHPNILINPPYALICSFDDVQDMLCHELIHAWLHWKGLVGTGEHLDEHHCELFVKKALEINQKKIRNLNVDVDYLLETSEAVDIYNRVAGIQFAPYLRHQVRKIAKTIVAYIKEIVEMFLGYERFSKRIVVSFSVVVIVLILNRAGFIPNGVASLAWIVWAVAVIIWHVVVAIRQRQR